MTTPQTMGRAATHQLAIRELFEGLTDREKLYAHHLGKAAWGGARIILRQTSPEGTGILDFILKAHSACGGEWKLLTDKCGVTADELAEFLEFAGMFLSSMGNYFGEGDRKVVPSVSKETLGKIALFCFGSESADSWGAVVDQMLETPPISLGFTDGKNQSSYYPGLEPVSQEEASMVAKVMEKCQIEPENTRLRKVSQGGKFSFEILQASAASDDTNPTKLDTGDLDIEVTVHQGDHAEELTKICASLEEAAKWASSDKQASLIAAYIESFKTGSMNAYRKSQKLWVSDISPRIENILGFVEPYRDPYGVRAEWEGAICISDPEETRKLRGLIDGSTKFIRMLPWAVPGENDGKGPFEASLFQAPDFTVVHTLAFCTSYVWEAVNLPNYSDIRETCGLKNIVFANRMNANNSPNRPCHYVDPAEVKSFRIYNHHIRFLVTAVHELLGHGTGKLLTETEPGVYNFDKENLPTSPITGKAITTWYKLGQTWTGVFEKLATTVEECRAMLVSYYLADHKEVLSMFGYDDKSEMTADDIIYYTYLHVGVEGISALHTYNIEDGTWGQPHARANFCILKHLLLDGGGVMSIKHDADAQTVHVCVDRSKITTHGRAALGRMLCAIHVWRCTADIESCKEMYDQLSVVDNEYEVWRKIVVTRPEPGWKFVQPNTILDSETGKVTLQTYAESNEGIIQSFAERGI